jgi:phosphohistidine swiveling domain-containing protein
LSAQNGKTVNFNKAFNILTSPSILSVVAKRDFEVAKLAKAFKDKEIDEKMVDKNLAKLTASTWWQDMGWDVYGARTAEILRNIFAELLEDTNLESKIKEWTEYEKNIGQAKQSLASELDLQKHPDFLWIMDVVDEFTTLHDWRKEFQMRELYVQIKLLKEMVKRRAIPFVVLEWATPDEVRQIFSGEKLDLPEIYQRARGFVILVKDGKMELLTGDIAERTWQEEREKIKGEMLDLGGISASRGKVVAPVFVALSAGEAMNIPVGHVLVTGMTTPEFVPAMKRASAIVTEEGGLTCHAAIISRELGKPCVVGTKYATRILKTGQTVEVAANHGVVKIINS